MNRVLAHIDNHLDQPLSTDSLAEVAHFSPYHFHRLFSAWTGEPLGEYLRRRRVEVAAMRLASQPRLSVMNTALSVGFGSGEAFSRAFKVRFGCSPSNWRTDELRRRSEKSNPSQVNRKIGHVVPEQREKNAASNQQREAAMRVQLVNRPPVKIAYLRHTGPYGAPISKFWIDTVAPWMAENDLMDRPRYGISHDDPEITAPSNCRYDAGVAIEEGHVYSGNAQYMEIPGGRYAALQFEDTLDKFANAWASLLRDWLPSSGLQLDARPCFEHYPVSSRYNPETGVMSCELCIPVAPL
ncbi:MAG: AraC family transcriptional regulator [Rhodanobacteraceae bacterium]